MAGIKESRREIAPGIEPLVRGEDLEPTDAVMAQVLCEMAAEAGGSRSFNLDDPATIAELFFRMRAKGVDLETGQWLC